MTLQELRDYAARFHIKITLEGSGFAVYRIVGNRAVYQGQTYSLSAAEKLVKKLCDFSCNGKA